MTIPYLSIWNRPQQSYKLYEHTFSAHATLLQQISPDIDQLLSTWLPNKKNMQQEDITPTVSIPQDIKQEMEIDTENI